MAQAPGSDALISARAEARKIAMCVAQLTPRRCNEGERLADDADFPHDVCPHRGVAAHRQFGDAHVSSLSLVYTRHSLSCPRGRLWCVPSKADVRVVSDERIGHQDISDVRVERAACTTWSGSITTSSFGDAVEAEIDGA